MNNMQILHECKDSRDDHFSQRRNRNRNRAQQLPQGISRTREIDDDNFDRGDDTEEAILEHLMSIDNSRSTNIDKSQQDVLTCLKYAEDGGLFSSSNATNLTTMDSDNANDEVQHVCEEQITMEDIWMSEYEQRRLQWKKKTCEPPSHTNLRPREEMRSNNSSSILQDGNAFRVGNSIEQDNETHELRIRQYTEISHLDTSVNIEQLIEEFTLNREQGERSE